MLEQEVVNNQWAGDKLNRKKDADFLTKYITEKYKIQAEDESFVININAEWGFGKTFFLRKWQEDLSKKHPVIYYDAWKNDFSKHPLSSFLYVFKEKIVDYLSDAEGNKQLFKGLIGSAIKYSLLAGGSYTGSLKNIYDEFTSVQDEIREEINKFVSDINVLAEDIKAKNDVDLPIYIMIDEMDRSRPNYSIELLEVIKHLFCTKYVCFVIATDSRQLEKSIQAIYGNDFNSSKYLNRFFDHEYILPKPNNEKFSEYIIDLYELDNDVFFTPLDNRCLTFSKMADFFRLPLREQHHAASLLEAIKLTVGDGFKGVVKDIDMFFLLFLIMLKLTNKEYFFEHERSSNPVNYLSKVILDFPDYDSSVTIDSSVFMRDSHGYASGSRPEKILISNILMNYHQELDKNLIKDTWHPDEAQNVVMRNTLTRLYQQKPRQFNSGDHISSDLINYFGIVKQVGQLV